MIWEVSYDHSRRGFFRFINEKAQTLYFSSIEGTAKFVTCLNNIGRLVIDTELDPHGEHVNLFYNSTVVQVPDYAPLLGGNYWRMCWRRVGLDWRFRNEHTLDEPIYVSRYVGIADFHWYDGIPHLYHTGDAYIIPELGDQIHSGYALLVPRPSGTVLDIPPLVQDAMLLVK